MSTTEPSVWTAPKIVLLRTLWAEGLSAAHIGRRLQVSKNAVIGKAHRLHLPRRPSPLGNGQATAISPPKIAAASAPPSACPKPSIEAPRPTLPLSVALPALRTEPPPEAPVATRIRATSRARSCQWPNGDPGAPGFHLCGDPAVTGKPYCETHCRRAYRDFITADAA